MKKRHKALLIIFSIIFGIPLILWLSWLLTTPRPISIFIMDKSSYSAEKANSRAVNWVLSHYRFVKTNGKRYKPVDDYYGFFPADDGSYHINDLQGKSDYDLDRLSITYHVAYFSDNYGVYSDTWPEERPGEFPAKKIYGGIHQEDLTFMEHMVRRNKLVISEFSFMGPEDLIAQAEEVLGIDWQGWTGKFFHTFDPSEEKSVPPWVPVLYKKQNGNPWPVDKHGIILVNQNEELVVLEYPKHLRRPYPFIVTERPERRKFGVSNKVPYPGWFDISLPLNDHKEILSWFDMDLTTEGRILLRSHGIPLRFPAVISQNHGANMYYFAGDFGYSPLKYRFVNFKGSRYAELFLSDLTDPTDKSGFFYAYYLPLMKNILSNYHEDIMNDE